MAKIITKLIPQPPATEDDVLRWAMSITELLDGILEWEDKVAPYADHGLLSGLTDVADHPGYLLLDGTRDLTGNWTIATKNITLTGGTLTAEHLRSTDDARIDDRLDVKDIVLGTLGSIDQSGAVVKIKRGLRVDTTLTVATNAYFDTNTLSVNYASLRRVGIGVLSPDAKLEVFHAGDQLKLSYDAPNYVVFAVQSNGDLRLSSNQGGVNFLGIRGMNAVCHEGEVVCHKGEMVFHRRAA